MTAAGARVLVVDDEPGQRQSLVELLSSDGFGVESFADAGGTLSALRRDEPAVVVLDWLLDAAAGGARLLDRLRADFPDCPVIVISGYPDGAIRDDAIRAGARSFLRKPFDSREFLQTVNSAAVSMSAAPRPASDNAAVAVGVECGNLLDWCIGQGPDMLCVVDRRGQLLHANTVMRAYLGLDEGIPPRGRLDTLISDDDWIELLPRLTGLRPDDESWQRTEQSLRPGDSPGPSDRFDLRLRAVRWQNDDGLPADGVAVVISARAIGEGGGDSAMRRGLHDILTGLPNRVLLNDRLLHSISRAQRRDTELAVMFIDLDRFKRVNDTLGHRIGDHLLRAAAKRIFDSVRVSDTLARYGGDEFVLLVDPAPESPALDGIAEKIVQTLSQPFLVEQHELHLSGSIGLSKYPQDASTVDGLIECADLAMYAAKQSGKNGFRHYQPEMRERLEQRLWADRHLHEALGRDEFVLHYQPQFRIDDESLNGFEALIRWNHPDRGLLPPSEFIAQAESSGLIGAVGEWVLRTVCQNLQTWNKTYGKPVRMTVNLSAGQLEDRGLLGRINNLMDEFGVEGQSLEVDIPEAALIENPNHIARALQELAERSIRIVIDDFGTGYSPLGLLHSLPISTLKLDGSFVRELDGAQSRGPLAAAVAAMAQGLGLSLAAEGVESRQQLERMTRFGAESAQGYYFSAAMPFDEASALLRASRH